MNAGDLIHRIFRNHAQEMQSKLDPVRVADWLLDYGNDNYVLGKALRAAAVCDMEMDPRPFTPLQQKLSAWGYANYGKLTVIKDRKAPISPELMEQRARSFGYWLAEPLKEWIEERAYEAAGKPEAPAMDNPYADAVRAEQEYQDRRPAWRWP